MKSSPPAPSEPGDKEAERRFNETLGRMLGTPHKPHAPAKSKPKKKS